MENNPNTSLLNQKSYSNVSSWKNGEDLAYTDCTCVLMGTAKNVPSQEQNNYLEELYRYRREQLRRIRKEEREEPVDAEYKLRISHDEMEAWLLVFPPLFGGKQAEEEEIRNVLKENKVTNGIDDEVVERLAAGCYQQMGVVARGVPVKNGEDGHVKEHVSRESGPNFSVGDNEIADYKNLNWVHKIHKGDVICDIIPPTNGEDGCTVTGKILTARPGRAPIVPNGKNTTISEDGLVLSAAVDGQINYVNGKFNVDPVLTISGDVDASTGNLDALGDIIVQGDVREGFILKASGNVLVYGLVEGATIVAGGDIQIKGGMNGNGHGTLDAKGEIRAKFLENCNVLAVGDVRADSIINCNVVSDGKILAQGSLGIIIGGMVMAFHGVEAKSIGNQANRMTTITVGSTPSFIEEKRKLEAEVRSLKDEISELAKNVDFLEKRRPIPPEFQTLQQQLKLRLSVIKMQHSKKKAKLDNMIHDENDLSNCYVRSSIIYPTTRVTIGGETCYIRKETRMCNIFFDGQSIVVGTKAV